MTVQPEFEGSLMGNRHEQRTAVSLPVRVSGVDREGNPFSQSAIVVEVSGKGARLADIRCLREPGDFIEIHHNHSSGRFRVEWIGLPGTAEDGQAGISAVDGGKNIWQESFAAAAPYPYEPVATSSVATSSFAAAAQPAPQKTPWDGVERRGSTRVQSGGTVRLQVDGASFPIWAELADISLGGCYVNMLIPMTVGASVFMSFTIQQQTVNAKGRVVTSDPGVGAGIRFDLDPTEMVDFWRLLRKMGSEINRDKSKP